MTSLSQILLLIDCIGLRADSVKKYQLKVFSPHCIRMQGGKGVWEFPLSVKTDNLWSPHEEGQSSLGLPHLVYRSTGQLIIYK